MAWSEIISAPATKHTRAFRTLATTLQNHPDPTVRYYALPGRLLCAGLPSDKFSTIEPSLHDPDLHMRAFALALLCGNWSGPWNDRETVAKLPYNNTQERIWPSHIFNRIWTINSIDNNALLGLASLSAHDPAREVRFHALTLFAKLAHTAHSSLRTISQHALSSAQTNDPDGGLRAFSQWLSNWLASP